MKSFLGFLMRELPSVGLALFSLVPLHLSGAVLDIHLTTFYARFEDGATALPYPSKLVLDNLAGYLGVSTQLMHGWWLLMLLCLVFFGITSRDQQQFRVRFIYSFLFIWTMAVTTALLIALACAAPSALLLARLDGDSALPGAIDALVLVELASIAVLPVLLTLWKKRQQG